MLQGIKIKPIKRFPDERGFFCEVMRKDWKDLFGEDKLRRQTFHLLILMLFVLGISTFRGQMDYFLALKGTIKICAFDDKTYELNEMISSGLDLQVVRIPGHYWHGFKAVGNEPAMLLYFTTNLYDPAGSR